MAKGRSSSYLNSSSSIIGSYLVTNIRETTTVKKLEMSASATFTDFKDGAPGGSLWSREHDMWKTGKTEASGFGRTMSSGGNSSSSGSSFNWDKAVNDAFNNNQSKK